MKLSFLLPLAALTLAGALAASAAAPPDTTRGDRMLTEYFRTQTAALNNPARQAQIVGTWQENRDRYRHELFEMLGLSPLPPRTDLKPVVTGKVDHPEFTVENLHFQSRPGLYVTGNLYIPKGLTKPAPAILYVCGHGQVRKNGVAYGSKVFYQHHGGWLARNGYVCLVIDTFELGEIEGNHHGTYRDGLWWWNARGYTPAGVEAWNSIRALDYLETRPEVDRERFGITGRSGGGAYSWYVAALDDRIKAAVPVAGITDLHNHVVDGTVEGHCDCMYVVNTHRWDYWQVAALIAPRPLLISNTDKDSLFPLEGVVRLHDATRQVYRAYNAADKVGLLITEGGHDDTQDIQVPALRWFNRFLKGEPGVVTNVAASLLQPEQLKVFTQLPADQINTRVDHSFVPTATAELPASPDAWKEQRAGWLRTLRRQSFGGWPAEGGALDLKPVFTARREGIRLSAYDFTSQLGVTLRLYLALRDGLERPDLTVLNVLDEQGWREWLATIRPGFEKELAGEALPEPDAKGFAELKQMFRQFKWGMAYVAPRGIGPTAWAGDAKKQTQIRRRFMLLGQTLDGMRVWDTRRAMQALRTIRPLSDVPLWLQSERTMAGVTLYAALFEPDVKRLDLWRLPKSHQEGPDFLNVLRVLDVPQAVAMAAETSQVVIYQDDKSGWEYPAAVVGKLGWDEKQFQVRGLPD